MKKETLYGIHPVLEALKAERRAFFNIYTTHRPSPRIVKAISLAEARNVPIHEVGPSEITSMTGTDLHQGIAARVSPYPLTELADIIHAGAISGTDLFLLLLDGVVDPQNLGALVRTALSVGIDGIIITKNRSAQPTSAVSRSSAGALEHVCLAQVTNMVSAIEILKKEGLWIAGLDRTGRTSLFSGHLPDSIALVIGGEHKGIRRLVKEHCDLLVSIPQLGQVASLNASVAGAVAMYEVFRQRHSE